MHKTGYSYNHYVPEKKGTPLEEAKKQLARVDETIKDLQQTRANLVKRIAELSKPKQEVTYHE